MAADEECIQLEEGLNLSSVDGDGYGESDVEVMSSASDQELNDAKDYWFGKKYIECIVAQQLLCSTLAGESFPSFDSKLMTELSYYPYDEKLKFLQAQGMARSDSDFEASQQGNPNSQQSYENLLTLVGTVSRTGGKREKQVLTSSLSKFNITTSSTQHKNESRSVPTTSFARAPPDARSLSVQERPRQTDIGRYTTALKEYGDQMGFQSSYDWETMSSDPPRFKAIVSFQDKKCDGVAKTKSLSKHLASEKMCSRLGIRVP